MPIAVEINNMSFGYSKNLLLENINLEIQQGDYFIIFGPNGSGKTTLLKIILGLLYPSTGNIKILGKKTSEKKLGIGYVPQYTEIKRGFPITVQGVVAMGLINNQTYSSKRQKEQKCLEMLQIVGIEKTENMRFDSLSGGQRQRTLIARALVSDPKLIIFDEPTANIDPQGKTCIYELLMTLNTKGTTIITVSHDIGILAPKGTTVAALNKNILTSKNGITQTMLTFLYGEHSHHCQVQLSIPPIPKG